MPSSAARSGLGHFPSDEAATNLLYLTRPTTHFLNRPVIYRYPDGLIMPLVYGLKGLLAVEDGRVVWATEPKMFLKHYLKDIAGAYRLVLDMARFDPQKLSKNQASHEFAVGEFEKALMKQQAKR